MKSCGTIQQLQPRQQAFCCMEYNINKKDITYDPRSEPTCTPGSKKKKQKTTSRMKKKKKERRPKAEAYSPLTHDQIINFYQSKLRSKSSTYVPLSVQNIIADLHFEDPHHWDFLRLSFTFGVKLDRIESICLMRQNAKNWGLYQPHEIDRGSRYLPDKKEQQIDQQIDRLFEKDFGPVVKHTDAQKKKKNIRLTSFDDRHKAEDVVRIHQRNTKSTFKPEDIDLAHETLQFRRDTTYPPKYPYPNVPERPLKFELEEQMEKNAKPVVLSSPPDPETLYGGYHRRPHQKCRWLYIFDTTPRSKYHEKNMIFHDFDRSFRSLTESERYEWLTKERLLKTAQVKGTKREYSLTVRPADKVPSYYVLPPSVRTWINLRQQRSNLHRLLRRPFIERYHNRPNPSASTSTSTATDTTTATATAP